MMTPPDPSAVDDIDFEIEDEGWNKYELSDGSTIRMRIILFKLLKMKRPPPGQMPFFGGFQTTLSVRAPSRLKGTPATRIYSLDEMAVWEKDEIKFHPIQEDWNVYRVPNGSRIKVKLVISNIERAKKVYDQFGDPMYVVSWTGVIAPIPQKKS